MGGNTRAEPRRGRHSTWRRACPWLQILTQLFSRVCILDDAAAHLVYGRFRALQLHCVRVCVRAYCLHTRGILNFYWMWAGRIQWKVEIVQASSRDSLCPFVVVQCNHFVAVGKQYYLTSDHEAIRRAYRVSLHSVNRRQWSTLIDTFCWPIKVLALDTAEPLAELINCCSK